MNYEKCQIMPKCKLERKQNMISGCIALEKPFFGNTYIKYLLFEHSHTGFAHGVSEKINNLGEVLQQSLISCCFIFKYLSCSLTYIALVKHSTLSSFHIFEKLHDALPSKFLDIKKISLNLFNIFVKWVMYVIFLKKVQDS